MTKTMRVCTNRKRLSAVRAAAILMGALCLHAASSAPSYAGPAEKSAAIYADFRRGDLGALFADIEKFLVEHPERPEAFLYIGDPVRLVDVVGHERVDRTLRGLLDRSSRVPESRRNLLVMKISMELEKLAALKDAAGARKAADALAPVREWSITGPYHRYGAYDIHYPWLPEAAQDMRSIDRRVLRLENADAILDFDEFLFPERGVAYALTTLKRGGPIRLRFQSRASYVVFINGRIALKNIVGETQRSLRVLEVGGFGALTVMVKVYRGDAWSFRMLTSDVTDVSLPCEANPDEIAATPLDSAEVMEYPWSELMELHAKGSIEASFHLGNYFHELDSDESLEYYKTACTTDPTGIRRFFMASAMREHNHGAQGSAFALESARIMNELAAEFPDFVPAAHMKFERLLEQRSLSEACIFGARLSTGAASYLPLREEYSGLLRSLEHEKEFEEHARDFQTGFPHADAPLMEMAEYYRGRDVVRCEEFCRKILARGYRQGAFGLLLGLLRDQGHHKAAIELLERFNGDGALNDTLIDVLIESGDYRRARNLLYKNTIRRKKPADIVRLGRLSRLEGGDPVMDWEKAAGLDPSDFATADLLDFVKTGKIEEPLERYRDERAEDHIVQWALRGHGEYSSEVVFRNYIFKINADGSSLALCEDVLYVHDQKGVEKWGEYRVPLAGKIHPLRARVYDGEGRYSDSFRIEEVNGAYYINLANLKEKSTIHVAYSVDNPFSIQGESGFTAIPAMILQDFEEPLHALSLKIVAPASVRLTMDHRADAAPVMTIRDENAIYSLRLQNLPFIKHEENAGAAGNHLPYFGASTMIDASDITQWYAGLLMNKPGQDGRSIKLRFGGPDDEQTAIRVYSYVENDIDLSGNALYYPDSPRDVEYKRKGTVEDKVLLARNILAGCGIKAFPAFAKRIELPESGRFVSPGAFSDILLFIPGLGSEGIWLDFSRRYAGFGMVSASLRGTEALVMGENGYERRTVRSRRPDKITRDYRFVIDEGGNAECTIRETLEGRHGTYREYFANSLHEERSVNQFFSALLPSLAIDQYEIANLESVDAPFVLSIKGRCFSVTPPPGDRAVLGMTSRTDATRYIQSAERALPLLIQEEINEVERYSFILPERFAGVEYGYEEDIACKFGTAGIRIKKKKGSAEVEIIKEVRVQAGWIAPEQYKEFLDFCMKLDEAEKREVIIPK
ncbi:MAG: hypothetical protein EPN93_05050 [Spirochaetes bacterium]|nr:MAG: hypothetical protein EPN93_05050 [Spirochaetota bacterium]